jgi:AcrR family transcriptional regulator
VIVRSAYAVLTDKGYDRTSMSDIARHANVGQGTVYRYFGSKRELLDHVFDYAVAKAVRALDVESLPRLDLTDYGQSLKLIELIGSRLFALVDADPAILRLITVESSAIDPELRHRVIGLVSAMNAALARLFQKGHPEGDQPTERAARAVLGRMVIGMGGPGIVMLLQGETSTARRAVFLSTVEAIADRGLLSSRPDTAAGRAQKMPSMTDRAAATDRSGQLYAAATELFVERGYRDVDVADIAARAGVSHGTFYNYFRNKRDVLEAILQKTESDLEAAVFGEQDPQSIVTCDDFVAEFEAKVRRAVAYVAGHSELVSFTALNAAGVDDDAYTSSLAGYRNLGGQITAFLAHGRDHGWVRGDVDLDVAGQAVMASVALAVMPILLGDDAAFDTAGTARTCSAYLLGGIRAALPCD